MLLKNDKNEENLKKYLELLADVKSFIENWEDHDHEQHLQQLVKIGETWNIDLRYANEIITNQETL